MADQTKQTPPASPPTETGLNAGIAPPPVPPADPIVESPQTLPAKEEKPSTEKSAEIPPTTPEKRKKTFLSKLSKVAKEDKTANVGGKFDANSDGYVSAREAINALNTGMVVDTPSDDEVLAAQVAAQLEKQAEYFVVRVRKSKMVLALGLMVLVLWLVPLTLFLQQKYDFSLASYLVSSTPSPTPMPTEEPTPTATPMPAVRIKTAAETTKVLDIKTVLMQAGFTQVEIEVSPIKDKGVAVAVKTGLIDLQKQLMTILTQTYPTATVSAAVLSDDSDFSAVITLGK